MDKGDSLLAETNDCGRSVLRLLSRGHAVLAELQRVADCLPPALRGVLDTTLDAVGREDAKRFEEVLPPFAVFQQEGALEGLLSSPEAVNLDEESRELHYASVTRLYRILAAIRKYWEDLVTFLENLEDGQFINHNLHIVMRDEHGSQMVSEAVWLLGTMLLITEDRLPSAARERGLVAFYRWTLHTPEAAEEFPQIYKMFKESDRPKESELASRDPAKEYPQKFFRRFPLPEESVRIVIGQLQTGDVYRQSRHYPLPEHRSHSLAAQAGILYVTLFFHPETLQTDIVAMREIVNRHFGDAWVIAYALGFTADLTAMWETYPAAKEALDAAITVQHVREFRDKYMIRLAETQKLLAEYLTEGTLSEEMILEKTTKLLDCMRKANTTIRWLLLQPTTINPKLKTVFQEIPDAREIVLMALVDTSLLEDKVRKLLGALVARRDADWAFHKDAAATAMDDLAVYFSGTHALRRAVQNKDLEDFFRRLEGKIMELEFQTEEDRVSLGRKLTKINNALQEVENYHEVAGQPQIMHFLGDARKGLQKMVRTVNLSQDLMETISVVADLTYAWKALDEYKTEMENLLSKTQSEYTPGSVRGLRALFLKLASILESPLKRIKHIKNQLHEQVVVDYYSQRLVNFMREVLQAIPRRIFELCDQIAEQRSARPDDAMGAHIVLKELQDYAASSEAGRDEVGKLTQQIALLMRGIRETDVAVLGVIRVEPRAVLVDGLRRELARKLEHQFSSLALNGAQAKQRSDLAGPLQEMGKKAQSLAQAFEYVQDYVGVSALRMWHGESGRILRFLLHMEQHVLLRHRQCAPQASPYHDADTPIVFPDARARAQADEKAPRAVTTRIAASLKALSDPKTTVGGLQGEWRRRGDNELLLDGHCFELLHQAVGKPGLAAVSRLLGLYIAGRVKKTLRDLREDLGEDTWKLLEHESEKVRLASEGGDDMPKALRESSKSMRALADQLAKKHSKWLDNLAIVGQHQLLRRRLSITLQLRSRLDAPLVSEALGALDGAELSEAVDCMPDESDTLDLPGLSEFLPGLTVDEQLLAFHRQLSRATELSGLGDPLRQIYSTVPKGSLPARTDSLLAMILLAAAKRACQPIPVPDKKAIVTPAAPVAQGSFTGPSILGVHTTASFQEDMNASFTGVAAHAGAVGSAANPTWGGANQNMALAVAPTAVDAQASLLTGLATILQQMPRTHTDGMLELLGIYLSGLVGEGVQGQDLWAEGAHLVDFTSELLDLLGLPREQLAEFIPQGLLDLWPYD